jgi:hypothetical protein
MARRGIHVEANEARRLRSQPGASRALDLTSKAIASGLHSDVRIYRLPDGRVLIDHLFVCMVYQSEDDVVALFEYSPEKHFTRPWPERRGNEGYDGNYWISAVLAPPDVVTAKLAPARAGVVHEAIGREVPAAARWMFVVRIQGQPSTLVMPGALSLDSAVVDDLNDLSRGRGTRVLHFSASDTMGSLEYWLVENGTEVERLVAWNDQVESFHSSRGTEAPPPGAIFPFVSDVCRALDFYLPAFSGDYFVGHEPAPRGPWPVRNPGQVLVLRGRRTVTTVPPFETVDYIWSAD